MSMVMANRIHCTKIPLKFVPYKKEHVGDTEAFICLKNYLHCVAEAAAPRRDKINTEKTTEHICASL